MPGATGIASRRRPAMTPRKHLLLRLLAQKTARGWSRPRHLGGTDASWHSRDLEKLALAGYVERRNVGRATLPQYEYRISGRGRYYLRHNDRPTKEMLHAGRDPRRDSRRQGDTHDPR